MSVFASVTQIGVSISIAIAKTKRGRGAHRDGIIVGAGPARGPELTVSIFRTWYHVGVL